MLKYHRLPIYLCLEPKVKNQYIYFRYKNENDLNENDLNMNDLNMNDLNMNETNLLNSILLSFNLNVSF